MQVVQVLASLQTAHPAGQVKHLPSDKYLPSVHPGVHLVYDNKNPSLQPEHS